MLQFSYYNSQGVIETRTFSNDTILIGSNSVCNLVYSDLAPLHVRIYWSRNGYYAHDIAGGLRINETPGSGYVRDDDVLQVGSVAIRVNIPVAQTPAPVSAPRKGTSLKWLGCLALAVLMTGAGIAGYLYFGKDWIAKMFPKEPPVVSEPQKQPKRQAPKQADTHREAELPDDLVFTRRKNQYRFDAEAMASLRNPGVMQLLGLTETHVRILEAKQQSWINLPEASYFDRIAQQPDDSEAIMALQTKILIPSFGDERESGMLLDSFPAGVTAQSATWGTWRVYQLGSLARKGIWRYGTNEASIRWENGTPCDFVLLSDSPIRLQTKNCSDSSPEATYTITGLNEDRMCGFVDWATPSRGIWWAVRKDEG